MGGATRYGESISLEKAVEAWQDNVEYYVRELGLFLSYGQIVYEDKTKVYHLVLRFSK